MGGSTEGDEPCKPAAGVLRSYARTKLPPPMPQALLDQLARILGRILSTRRRPRHASNLDEAQYLDHVVHTDVLPDRLEKACREQLAGLGLKVRDKDGFILGFAVALYPRMPLPNKTDREDVRCRKLGDLRGRLGAFHAHCGWDVETMSDYVAQATKEAALAAGLCRNLPLTYLWTAHDQLLATMVQNFRDDGEFVNYLREYWPTPPAEEQPSPHRSGEKTTEEEKKRLDALYDRTCRLRGRIAGKAMRCGVPGSENVTEAVVGFWKRMMEQLDKAICHYQFESHFARWVWMTLKDFDFQPFIPGERIADKAPHRPPVEGMISWEAIRIVREGYRLVRTMFQGACKKMNAEQAVRANEETRRTIDDLFLRWTSRGESGDESKMVQEIADEHGREVTTVNNWFSDLRLRMKTYSYARYPDGQRLSNREIFARARPRSRGPEIASIAKTARGDRSFAWTWIAYVMLRGLVDPKVNDPWTFERIVGEMADSWLTDEYVRRGMVADLAAQSTFASCLHEALVRAAAELDYPVPEGHCSSEDYEQLVEGIAWELERAGAVNRIAAPLTGLLFEFLGHGGQQAVCRDCERGCDEVPSTQTCWVIPVWFLARMEAVEKEEILRRLRPEGVEISAVESLLEEFRSSGTPRLRPDGIGRGR